MRAFNRNFLSIEQVVVEGDYEGRQTPDEQSSRNGCRCSEFSGHEYPEYEKKKVAK